MIRYEFVICEIVVLLVNLRWFAMCLLYLLCIFAVVVGLCFLFAFGLCICDAFYGLDVVMVGV